MVKNNIEHNSWYNAENEDKNWFHRQWESVRSFFEWNKSDVIWNSGAKSEWLKDLVVDSSLLDMEKWSELSDSEIDTKEQLDQFFEKWKKNKKDLLNQKELSQQVIHNSEKFQWRSSEAVHEIENAAMAVENDIKNWGKEENPIARILLKTANWIMDTENKA